MQAHGKLQFINRKIKRLHVSPWFFFSHQHEPCVLERVGVSVCGACLIVCAGVWVHSHVWGGTLTQKCCAEQSSPSSCPLLLPSYRRLEGRRCGKVGGRKLAREDGREGFQHPHQSLKQTFEDKCRKPPLRDCACRFGSSRALRLGVFIEYTVRMRDLTRVGAKLYMRRQKL